MLKLIIGVIVVAVVAIVGFMIIDPNVGKTTNNTSLVDNPNTLKVTVEGEVSRIGTYAMEDGSTIGDLIEAAGGLTANADVRAFFETSTLTKGQTYFIAGIYNQDDVCNNEPIEKVNINADDEAMLMKINGITASIASSIVDYRVQNGIFNTIEQLTDVYGIGAATYNKVRNYVILHEWLPFLY